MVVNKCDLCKKEIEEYPVTISFGFSPRAQFCNDCANPVLTFLEKHTLLNKEKNKIKLS